ncbi:MAG: glycosyltransferase [Mogibacterium sp.]|nr:glycosyltransferase [Mogibacterium sp.]
MKKVLFLIHDLGQGGAEKVLVNLVNHMDRDKFDITVMTLFDCGENRELLSPHIRCRSFCKKMFRGNSHLMKLLTPRMLHRMIVKEHYDIEVAYLEGPSARVISGCEDSETKLISWIHIVQGSKKKAAASFRSVKEAEKCYQRFDRVVCVSEAVKEDFAALLPLKDEPLVIYNTNDTDRIKALAEETVTEEIFDDGIPCLLAVGKLLPSKGFHRIIRILRWLLDNGLDAKLILLGDGAMRCELERLSEEMGVRDRVNFLGYQTNPYKYMKMCNLLVCASYAEGFSTAATEAMILGLPVCTVDVAGMRELLGEDNQYGMITSQDDEALYEGIRTLLVDPALMSHYRQKAIERSRDFETEITVKEVEELLLSL